MNDTTVQAILAAIDEREIIEFEREMVRIPSFTTEETELARFIAHTMEQVGHGLEVELQEVPLEDGRTSHNVVARLRGSGGGSSLLFFGHLDHLPILGRRFAGPDLEGWSHEPFAADIEDGWLYGKGAQDEKGGIAGFMMAAAALARSGFRPRGDIVFAGVQGHKRVSSGIMHLLASGVRADYAINSENSGNMVVNAFVGRSEGKIHVKAPELHFHTKSIFPEFKERLTAFELMHLVQGALGPEMRAPAEGSWMTFEAHPDLPEYPQYRMEVVEFHGIQHLVLELQIRTVPGMTDAGVRADLERLLAPIRAAHPYLTTEVEWPSRADSRPAVAFDPEHPVSARIAKWHKVVAGTSATVGALGRLGAAADASHVVAAGIDTILYGPGGGTTDRDFRFAGLLRQGPPDERICLADVVLTAKVFALVAADLCG